MKKILLSSIVTSFIILAFVINPSVTEASWWNPVTWFNNWSFSSVRMESNNNDIQIQDVSKVPEPTPVSKLTTKTDSRSDPKVELMKFSNSVLSFEYPSLLTLKQDGDSIVLNHSISYKHSDPCDFKGDSLPLEKLNDFSVNISVVNKSIKDIVQTNWEYVSKNPFKSDLLNGYKTVEAIEGCGSDVYYLVISPTKTLVIKHSLVTEFNPIIANYKTFLNLPGIITANKADDIYKKILSSIKLNE